MKKQKINNLKLWKKFQNEKNKTKKEKYKKELVEIYYPLVQKLSYKMASKIQFKLSPEELASSGVDGLYNAIDKFQLDRGVNFKSFSTIRIIGSMIDIMRKNDFIPRSVRINKSLIEKTKQKMETENCEKVTEYEVIEKLGISQEKYLKNIKKYNPLSFISIDGTNICNHDKQENFKQEFSNDFADKKISSPDSDILKKEFINKLISKNFSRLEQKIIYYYYYCNFTMGEIGDKLNTSESRISQLHSDILIRLKNKIKRNPSFFEKYVKE
jgi:RNA polymerase sigma factor FliA